ncbi:MAG TPA: BTAD domain-containing putative transcriptional regulator [Streptosporangiaceae bacterium]
MSSELRFAVLGPVRAWRGPDELDLGAPQQRVVLARLLLAEGRHVSLDALIAALWDEPPRAATGTVRTYVSRLRRILGAGAGGESSLIESAGDGYRFPLRSTALDLKHFLRLTKEAQAAGNDSQVGLAQAAGLLRDALGLWQGMPLAGLPGPYAESQRVRLTELYQAATEDRLAADIELGRHVGAAAELQNLVASHPMRERLRELLMLALYRSGRQADALAAFGDAQRLLSEELGIDPGPGLRDMHQRILQMDERLLGAAESPAAAWPGVATPAVPAVRPAQLPADLSAFTNRKGELAQLNSLVDQGVEAAPVIATIGGMAGIGKTALAVHWAHQVAGQFPDGQLYVNLRGFDPFGTPTASGEALRGFLDSLGVAPQRIPDGLQAQAGLYRSLLDGRRMLVLLDNARDVEQVRPLLPGSPGCLVIITSRNQLTGLVTTHNARSLTLYPFSADDARDALTRRLGPGRLAAEPDALAEITDLCAGLPLAVAVVAARASIYPGLTLAGIAGELRDARTRLDALSATDAVTDVRAVFSWSYQQLSAPARRLFRLASVQSGPEMSRSAIASLAGVTAADVQPLLNELTSARLVAERRPGRFMAHDLIRLYSTELGAACDSEEDRRAALGRILDYYLHTAYQAHLQLRPHFVQSAPPAAGPGVTPDQLSGYGPAMAWFAAERPVLEAAIGKAATAGFSGHAWRLALTMQQFYQRQGYWNDWAATMRTALEGCVAGHDLAAQALVRRSLAGAYHHLGRDDDALLELEHARELFTGLGDSAEDAYLDSNFATVFASQGHYGQAIDHYWRAYDLYGTAGHVKGQAAALEGIGWCQGQRGRYHQAVRYAETAKALYRRIGDGNGEADCWARLGEFLHELGQCRRAVDCHRRAITLCRQLGRRADEAAALTGLGDSALAAGSPGEAREAWDEALAILEELRLPLASQVRDRQTRLASPPPEHAAWPAGAPAQVRAR